MIISVTSSQLAKMLGKKKFKKYRTLGVSMTLWLHSKKERKAMLILSKVTSKACMHSSI